MRNVTLHKRISGSESSVKLCSLIGSVGQSHAQKNQTQI